MVLGRDGMSGQGQTVVTVRYPITTSNGEVLRNISNSP